MKSFFYTLLFLGAPIVDAFAFSGNINSGAYKIKYVSDRLQLQMAKKAEEPVVNFKKAEFVSSVAEKTGLTKTDAEAAMQAVIDTITEVRIPLFFVLLS